MTTATATVAVPAGAISTPTPEPVPPPTADRSRLAWAVGDAWTMVGRSVRHATRKVDSLLMSVILPILLMLLFVYVFGGAIATGTRYVTYVVPGIIILCVSYGASQTGISVTEDLVENIVDRFRTLPIMLSSVLIGHVVASVARNLVSTALVIALAVAIGFRPTTDPLAWAAAGGLLVLVILAISWVSVCCGLLAKSAEGASGFGFFILFLPYLSSAFVPTSTMPSGLQAVADHQPITPMIETIRGLLTGVPVGATVWVALAWYVGILVVAIAAAARLFARRTAG